MLTLTRRNGERIKIGDDIEITLVSVTGNRARIGIRAPRELTIYRAEVVERIEEENQRALAARFGQEQGPVVIKKEDILHFPEGLYGMRAHRQFILCDVGDDNVCRALVSLDDPNISLLVVDAEQVWANYPTDLARRAAGMRSRQVALAAVVTAPADNSPATVNLAAPLVIDLETRQGKQVILEHEELGIRHTMSGVMRVAKTG